MVEEARLEQPAGTESSGPDKESAPAQIHLPSPSIWPIALGLGVTLIFFGVLTAWAFSLAGAVLFVAALAKWIGQIRRESLGGPEHDVHG
jgi:hypothetical protein